MRGQLMRAPQLRAGARVAKRLFVAAVLVLSVLSTPNAGAQTLENQAEVDQALKELADATKGAQDTIPGNPRIKDAEDTFDAAVRKNEDTPADPKQAKDQAQNAQDNAKARADGLRTEMADRTSAEQAERAKQYRDALQKRRAARKKLQEVEQRARKLASNAQNQGLQDVLHLYQGQISRIRAALNGSQVPVARPKQTAALQPARTFVQTAQTMPAAGQQTARTEHLQWHVTMTGGAVNRNANATISRIKRSVIGVGEIPDVSNVKQNDVGATGELRIQIPVGAAASGPAADSPFCREMARRGLSTGCGPSIDLGYRYTGVDGSTSGAGPQIPVLLFTGLGVPGMAGNNSIPGGYSVLNQPHTYGYHYEFDQHQLDAVFRLLGMDVGPSTVIQPIVGASARFTGIKDSFATNVTFPNGFPVDSLHTTNTDMLSGGLFAGMNLYHAPPESPFVFIFSARGGFDVNRAESDVAFSIRTPTFFDLQRVTIKDTAVTPYVRVEGGVATNILGATVQSTIFAKYGGAFSNVKMPGGGALPYIDFTNETSFGGQLSATWALWGSEPIDPTTLRSLRFRR